MSTTTAAAPFLSSSWYRVAKLRPKLREHATIQKHGYRGSIWYIVHDHATGRVHRLSRASYVVVATMDGVKSVNELWEEAGAHLGEEAPSQDELIQLLAQLNAADLLQTQVTADSTELFGRAKRAERSKFLQSLLNPLAVRVRLWHPDGFLDRTLSLVGWMVTWRGAAIWLLVVLPAIVLAAQHWQELTSNSLDRILATDNLVLMTLSYLVLKALHELGHAYAVKAFGGPVHEFGVMFLVFVPVPYVDASAGSDFRSKWRRALVGSAGMMVEVFLAAIALYVWLAVDDGLVRALAYNVMLVAGIATVLFNGNPLLRYDGYYILSDLLEIPNLAQRATRYWGYLVERYLFRVDHQPFHAERGERIWLFLYAPAALLYRVAIILAIAMFISAEYFALGVAIGALGLFTGLIVPVGKALRHVIKLNRTQRDRARAIATTLTCAATAAGLLFLVPVPAFTTTEGVVWLPETAVVRAATSGFVRRLLVEPGTSVTPGEALVECEDPTLDAAIAGLRARVDELEATLAAERFTDRAKAEITATELKHAQVELATQSERARRLTIHSRADGTFALHKPQDLPGRFLRQGQEVGYVLPAGTRIVRATIRQDDIELVRHRLRDLSVRLAERPDETLPARILREVPAGSDELPSKALAVTGGGALATDPRNPEASKTYNRVFQIDIEFSGDAAASETFGGRSYVRFNFDREPLAWQIWRRTRQLLLWRLST